MICKKLVWFIESNNLLPDEMTGFREILSTNDSVLDFTRDLYGAFKRHTLAVFLGITKAFDSVKHDVVLNALRAT